jgi:subtilisin family serine protease
MWGQLKLGRVFQRGHSGARELTRKPGIQKRAPSSRLDSGFALAARPGMTGVGLVAAVATLAFAVTAVPAAAQMRTDIGSRGLSVGPRMMSPGSFGMRLDPTFRTSPGAVGEATRSDTVATDPGGGSMPPTRTITRKSNDGGKKPDTTAPRSTGVPPAGERRYVADEVVIEIAGSPAEATIQALATRFRLTRLESRRLPLTNATFFRWRIPDRRSVPEVIRALAAAAVTAQPNYLYLLSQQDTAALPPAGSASGDPAQYALVKLRLSEAHGIATGDQVAVAVIDSGIDATHPELDGVVADSFDALDSAEGPHAHGTGVAGIIAAHARLKGAAPRVKILAARAFGANQGSTFSIVKALDWALSKNARIINMSFAGPSDPLFARALTAARHKGAILIAAAGNAGPKSKPLYPGADPNVIAVTATDADDKLFAMANRGAYVAVAAPGVDILMPSPGGGYWVSTGTSMAAAYVSGVAALVLERQPRFDGEALRKLLAATARDLGPKGRDDQFGAGLIDAYQAIMALEAKAAETMPASAKR